MFSTWKIEVSQLRIQYQQLLFFTVPKLLHLYNTIVAEMPDINAIVQEVGFLFQNKPLVLQRLKEAVQVHKWEGSGSVKCLCALLTLRLHPTVGAA